VQIGSELSHRCVRGLAEQVRPLEASGPTDTLEVTARSDRTR
jgi:hypothetical protein